MIEPRKTRSGKGGASSGHASRVGQHEIAVTCCVMQFHPRDIDYMSTGLFRVGLAGAKWAQGRHMHSRVQLGFKDTMFPRPTLATGYDESCS